MLQYYEHSALKGSVDAQLTLGHLLLVKLYVSSMAHYKRLNTAFAACFASPRLSNGARRGSLRAAP